MHIDTARVLAEYTNQRGTTYDNDLTIMTAMAAEIAEARDLMAQFAGTTDVRAVRITAQTYLQMSHGKTIRSDVLSKP